MTSDPSGQLLSLLSHELRSPLGVIRGYLRLLDDPSGSLTAQQRQAVAAAIRAADQAAHLLGQASFLAQLRRGETQWNPSTVDVKALRGARHRSPLAFDAPVTCVIVREICREGTSLRAAINSAGRSPRFDRCGREGPSAADADHHHWPAPSARRP